MIKKMALALILATAFSAVVVSASQLKIVPSVVPGCFMSCDRAKGCAAPCTCVVFAGTTGQCLNIH